MANAFPGLYKRGNKYWYAYQIAGKRTFVSLQTSSLAEAVTNAQLLQANPTQKSGKTVLGLMEAFVRTKQDENRFTEATRRAALVSLKDFAIFTRNLPVHSITRTKVQAWFEKKRMKTSESTAQTHLMRVRSFFKWCIKSAKVIDRNPAATVEVGKATRTARLTFCTRAERDKLIDSLPVDDKSQVLRPDLKFVLFCGFYAGLRRNEISEARPDWFDLERGLLHVQRTDTFTPKDREDRTIPLANPFLDFMQSFDMSGKYCIASYKETRGRKGSTSAAALHG